ncbi:iron complex transport system permease protein [Desulfobacula phenolica]|uniref:Iron complex transport system permease protein n=2 Tax=Desulfobacula phenolica TaxID=90732 RepID=A0A1H2FGY0_9BACT|nr:iron complex transport system permease protein [Desulfobacula phenolica]
MKQSNSLSRIRFYILIFGSPLVLIFISVFLGRYPISISDILTILASLFTGQDVNATHFSIILHVRLPRVLLGAMVGGCLAVSGAAFQGLFRNPLVSSGMLGVSSGAGFGAALAIILFKNFFYVYPFSFGFGLVAVFLCFFIGRITSSTQAITLVLGGVIVGSIFSALISFLKYVADPYDELPAIVFWLMGSLSRAEYSQILTAGIPMFMGSAGLMIIRWRLNVLAMGDKEAQSLGVKVNLNRVFIIICATLATAGAVCVSGVIGWVGLVVPHMGRMMIGNNNRDLIPVTFSIGATFLVIVDDISRLISTSEMPLGILTALIGGPFFIYLLKQTKGREW